jgi:hypothetical protein
MPWLWRARKVVVLAWEDVLKSWRASLLMCLLVAWGLWRPQVVEMDVAAELEETRRALVDERGAAAHQRKEHELTREALAQAKYRVAQLERYVPSSRLADN